MPTNLHLFTCPLCGEASDEALALRDHLGSAHGLVDDPGTDTLVSLRPPDPEPEPEPEAAAEPEQKREAQKERPARAKRPKPVKVRPERAVRPRPEPKPKSELKPKAPKERTVPLTERLAARLRARRIGPPPATPPASEPYPLAMRYGDSALYVPGAALLLLGLIDDRIGWAVVGVALLVLGMLLPVVHALGTASSIGSTSTAAKPPQPAGSPNRLEDTLLGLSTPSANHEAAQT